jgi:putative membrane protein
MKRIIQGTVLLAMAIFLASKLINGTLGFFINRRFVWLTAVTVIGLVLVAFSYLRPSRAHVHHHQESNRSLPSFVGSLLLVAIPVILGLTVPPQPLGADAMGNREVNVGSLVSVASPANNAPFTVTGEKNILDWLTEFQKNQNPDAFTGQAAHVTGFVYRDGRFGNVEFLVSRFVVSCCVADAMAVGLLVRWPDAGTLAADRWVDVTGHFEPGEFNEKPVPVLIPDAVDLIDPPAQPYLYP